MSTPFEVTPGFDDASNEQRIAFVPELWDRIAADPQRVPAPPEHRRILEERLTAYRTDAQLGRAWCEVREERQPALQGLKSVRLPTPLCEDRLGRVASTRPR